jgi:histidyl-tRNA synthetase
LQANIDLIGSDSIEADVEVVDLALSMIRDLAIDMSRIEIRLNDRRLLEGWLTDAGITPENQANVLSLLDEKDKLEPEVFRTRLVELSSTKSADVLIQKLSLSPETLSADEKAARLCETQRQLAALGWQDNVKIDPTIIRGFIYYTGIVFEVYEMSGQFRRAIFGGGRYDGLVEALGGSPVSGVGFGVSDVSLEELLCTQNKEVENAEATTVMVIPFSEAEVQEQTNIVALLRKNEIATATSFPPYGFSPQLKLAQKKNIATVILLAPDELKERKVLVRSLKSGAQETVAISALITYLKKLNQVS